MGAQDQRPRFYEGQYLSAEDLAAIIEYQRVADARYALGAHTWGIAAGLTLTEKPSPGIPDKVEMTLQPGLAWDGYGRALLVSRPTRLPEIRFNEEITLDPTLDDPGLPDGPPGRLVRVWLQYQESGARPPAPGFETCLTDDQSGRVRESFDFVIGEKTGPDERGQVNIGPLALEATEALKTFDSTAGKLWDASVPHQTFPTDARPPRRWLVPIGYARWVARPGGLGYFIKRDKLADPDFAALTRAFRRYVGAVAEYVQAPSDAIVLHRRNEQPDVPFTESDGLKRTFGRFGALLGMTPTGDDEAKKKVRAKKDELRKDLVWVEGNLRVEGDAKIAGGQLHFRDADGLDHKTPLYMVRAGDTGGAAEGKRELRTLIGPAGQTDNRFIVGCEDGASPPGISPHFVVVSEGKVGVNTLSPAAKLEVTGNWTGDEGAVRISGDKPAIRFSGGAPAGSENWLLQVGSDGPGNFQIAHRDAPSSWKTALHVTPSLRVGVGTPKPRNPLGVRGTGTAEELISFEAPDGTTKWHLNQNLGGDKPGLNFVETGIADARLFLKPGGNVGIGTTNPQFRLDVPTGWFRFGPGGDGGRIFAEYGPQLAPILKLSDLDDPPRIQFQQIGNGDEQNPQFSAWIGMARGLSSNLAMMNADIGIGTTSPDRELHIKEASSSSSNGLRVENADNTRNLRIWVGTGGGVVDAYSGANLHLRTNGSDRLFIRNSTGNVGIGTTDTDAKLKVQGDLTILGTARKTTGSHWSVISDERLKTEVEPLAGALDMLLRLRGVRFKWRDPEKFGASSASSMGLLAQETEKVLPEWVSIGPDGYKELTISGFEALVIESVRALNAKCERLEAELAKLKGGGDAKATGEDKRKSRKA